MNDTSLIMTLAVLPLIVFGAIAEYIARGRGRSSAWFFLGAIFPPLILLLLALKPKAQVDGHWRQCPECAEIIKWQARVCRHCQSKLAA